MFWDVSWTSKICSKTIFKNEAFLKTCLTSYIVEQVNLKFWRLSKKLWIDSYDFEFIFDEFKYEKLSGFRYENGRPFSLPNLFKRDKGYCYLASISFFRISNWTIIVFYVYIGSISRRQIKSKNSYLIFNKILIFYLTNLKKPVNFI